MRVLFAPGPFPGMLTSAQVASAMAQGWLHGAPHDLVETLPLADGTDDFLDVVAASAASTTSATDEGSQVEVVPLVIRGPGGTRVPASLVLVERDGARTAYLDATQAVVPHLGELSSIDPRQASSVGVADLLLAALATQARRIVVAVGPSRALDGGRGLFEGLVAAFAGPTFAEPAAPGLPGLPGLDRARLADLRERWRGVDLVLATDADLPLLGFHGMAATTGAGLGLDPEATSRLEAGLGRYVDQLTGALSQRDLLTGRPRRLDREAGAGAGGGIGYALLLLGARRIGASAQAADLARLADRAENCDLVVTAVSRLDRDAARVGVLPEVAAVASAIPVPLICVAVETSLGRREGMSLGLAGSYPLAERPDQLVALRADPLGCLQDRLARLARTWSPAR